MGSSIAKMLRVLVFHFCFLSIYCSGGFLKNHNGKTLNMVRDYDCAACTALIGDLLQYDTSAEGVQGQTEALMVLCDEDFYDPAEVAECREVLAKFWAELNPVWWSYWFNVEYACEIPCGTNGTMAQRPKERCAECMLVLEYLEEAMHTVEGQVNFSLYLEYYFCPVQQTVDPEECVSAIVSRGLVPRIFQIFLNADNDFSLSESNFWFCSEIHHVC